MMNYNRCLLLLSSVAFTLMVHASPVQKTFEVKNPDTKLSPYTGMSRDHWKQAAASCTERGMRST